MSTELWTDFAVRMVRELAWPAVVIGGAVFLRQELRDLVRRVTKARVGAAEFEMQESARYALVEAESAEALPSSGDASGAVVWKGKADGLATGAASDGPDVGDDEGDALADLVRYEYVRQIVDLAERVLPPGVPRPEIGYGSLGAVLSLTPDVPPLLMRLAEVADASCRSIVPAGSLTLEQGTRILRLLRELDAFGRSRSHAEKRVVVTQGDGLGTFVATNHLNSDSTVLLQLAAAYSGNTEAVACYVRRRGQQSYIAASRVGDIPRRASGHVSYKFPSGFEIQDDVLPAGDYVVEWWAVPKGAHRWDLASRTAVVATDGFTLPDAPPIALTAD